MAQEGQTGPQNDPTSSTSPTTTEAKMPKLAVDRVSTAEEVMQELLLGQKVDKLVDQWTKAESESDRETIHKQLYDAVKAQSEARLAIQEKEIAPLEVKVEQLRSQLELRRKNRRRSSFSACKNSSEISRAWDGERIRRRRLGRGFGRERGRAEIRSTSSAKSTFRRSRERPKGPGSIGPLLRRKAEQRNNEVAG